MNYKIVCKRNLARSPAIVEVLKLHFPFENFSSSGTQVDETRESNDITTYQLCKKWGTSPIETRAKKFKLENSDNSIIIAADSLVYSDLKIQLDDYERIFDLQVFASLRNFDIREPISFNLRDFEYELASNVLMAFWLTREKMPQRNLTSDIVSIVPESEKDVPRSIQYAIQLLSEGNSRMLDLRLRAPDNISLEKNSKTRVMNFRVTDPKEILRLSSSFGEDSEPIWAPLFEVSNPKRILASPLFGTQLRMLASTKRLITLQSPADTESGKNSDHLFGSLHATEIHLVGEHLNIIKFQI
jgi:protein-tyrosine-phosphatase